MAEYLGESGLSALWGKICEKVEVRARVASGTYAGTGDATKSINVGFRPKLFMLAYSKPSQYGSAKYFYLKLDDGGTKWLSPDPSTDDFNNFNATITDTGLEITSGGNEDGFGNAGANDTGRNYAWIAIG